MPARRIWSLPVLKELPKLTDLTLTSAVGGGGGTGGGGSTVFGLLLAAGLTFLSACASNDAMAPTTAKLPAAVTAVTCMANVATKAVLCGGPLNTPPANEILGGQGSRVVLRSSNVAYTGTDFTFDVTVQNVGAQTLGTDGQFITGVRVFFENDPVATNGSGTITVEDDSVGTFTATGQSYYVYPDSLPVDTTSASRGWHFSVPSTVNTFTFQVLISSQVTDHGGLLRWQQVSTVGHYLYIDIASSGGNDALAVGQRGQAKRWNGTSWTPVNPVTTEDLMAVAAARPGVYIAVGSGGKVWQFAKNVWTQLYASPSGTFLNAVWARDTAHWYAVGLDETIITYDAGAITESRVPGGQNLSIVTGTATNALTAVGAQNGSFFVSTAGGPFLAAPSPTGSDFLLAMAYDADGILYTGSLNGGSFSGQLIRHGATEDTLATPAFATFANQIIPFAHDSMIATQFNLSSTALQVTKYRYGAVPISSVVVGPVLPSGDFGSSGVKLNAAGTAFATLTNAGDIVVTTGATWDNVETPGTGPFNASWGEGDSVWVADSSGRLLKIVDGVATPLIGVVGALDIWGFGGNELYIIADSTVWKGDGINPWTIEAQIPLANGTTVRGIWGDPASGTLLVTAGSHRFLQRVGGVWSEPGPVGTFLKGVWGCSATQAWMVTVNGQVYDWTPAGATLDPAFTSGAPVYAVTGTSCTDVWAAGPNSQLFHWDGATWTQVLIGGDQIFIESAVSRDVGIVYVAGEDSKVAAVSVSGATSRMLANNQNDDIRSLWKLDNGQLVVTGTHTVVLGKR